MRQQIRFFALGLLTAALLIYAFYVLSDETNVQVENIPTDTLVSQLESDGYRVITEEEFIDYSFYQEEKKNNDHGKNTDKEDDKEVNEMEEQVEEENNDEEEVEEVTSITLSVTQGDVSQDIAEVLKDEGMIEDEFEFVQYLEDNDYSPYIQLGTFEVTSDMDLKEIAETITTYPTN